MTRAAVVAQIRAAYAGWRFFQSNAGRWWATRGTSAAWASGDRSRLPDAATGATLAEVCQAINRSERTCAHRP